MLQIKKITNQNELLDHIYIHNKYISCKIFHNLGASIQEFIVNGVSIIDGITIDQIGIDEYYNTHKSSLLFPFPNRVKDGNYNFGGSNYQLKINEPKKHNAIHGMLFDKHFKIVDHAVNSEEASVSLSYTSDGTMEGYPFKFVFIVKYTIKPEGALSVTFDIKNTDKVAFPFGIGWHPYFKSDNLEDGTLTFASKEHFIFNERSIPDTIKISEIPSTFSINKHTYDDGFSLINASVIYKDSKYILAINFENNIIPYLHIYTPDHRKNIAIEPMTCATDAFNNKHGLLELEPKHSFKWVIEIKITPIE